MCFFFFNDTATTEIYTLPLHDALPISGTQTIPSSLELDAIGFFSTPVPEPAPWALLVMGDRKSTRLNSSHSQISYAVFCLKRRTEAGTAAQTASQYEFSRLAAAHPLQA